MSPWFGLGAVLVSLGALIGGVKLLSARGAVDAEGSRKLVHIGMGMICLTFPWVFRDVWPVWLLAGAACLALAALRVVPQLRREFGGVLHGVQRVSWGEMYFPLGVAVVFALSRGLPLLFLIPVAALTFADAAGALVGKRFGRLRFTTVEGTKTVEGSAAVGLMAFACALVPLLWHGQPRTSAVLIAVLIGLFALLVEAISWRGLDNVFLPLAIYAQVRVCLDLPVSALVARLAVLLAIALVAFVWRRGRIVDESARLGGTLALYFFWVVGGWTWLLAPLVLLVSYIHLMPAIPGGIPQHNMVAVICVAAAGLVWCVGQSIAPDGPWLWLFTLSLAAQQAVIAMVRFSQGRPKWPRSAWWAIGVLQAASLHGTVFWMVDRGATLAPQGYAVGAAALAATTAAFALWEPRLQMPDDLSARWWKQGLTALATSLAGFLSFI